ncbi:hypothetical protein [Spirosoma agri]|uniref:Uncharacterized protein n=1 Tax=Spirosoma agri TaxID=1987381 RepID=A0A6M0IJ67_9BACT|nr:hypothetical protein [Spirosoma agri]NEU68336.1 hypothetical protein [Spirosoma agri]
MNTYLVNKQSFRDGDSFIVVTPELGQIHVTATKQEYSTGTIVGLDMGWIKTGLPCQQKHNARLSFYSNGAGYHTLQLAYFCLCGYHVHNHCLTWFNLAIEGNTIIAHELGYHFNQPHNHPVTAGYQLKQQQIKLEALLVAKPVVVPDPQVGSKGQLMLF